MKATTINLSITFSELLKQSMLPSEFETMVNQQSINPVPNACYSHNFCDANEVMHEAFKRVMGREIDNDSDEDTRLWESAWSLAKENSFYSKPNEPKEKTYTQIKQFGDLSDR